MPRLVFGDVVVALSEWTRGRLLGAGVSGRLIRVIPPCAQKPREPTPEERARVRARFDLGTGPVVLYPGDYEVSRGAQTVAEAVGRIVRKIPEARVVFACRPKTSGAAAAAAAVRAALEEAGLSRYTRDTGEIDDMPALLAESQVVVFPVDDLYGKVDVPLVLLEALALGAPLVLARGGPLETLEHARFVDPTDGDALAREVVAILEQPTLARAMATDGRALYERRFRPAAVAAAYDDLYEELLR
jgi:phosphatidylinositol alpha-1,6-mannosyltransferase